MNLRILRDPAELARTAAGYFVARVRNSVALSGGSTPRMLYELLADPAQPFRQRIDWDRSHFFFTDERHVPPDHPDSNYRMAHEAMLSRAPVPQRNVHRMPGEIANAADAARKYEETLSGFFGETTPRFDLVLLGLGEDGHTASIFPDSEALRETSRLVAAPWVEKLNSYRLTLTLPVLNNAASVVFLVSGETKAEVLRDVLQTDPNPARYPAQAINPTNGELLWLVDEAAAALIERPAE